MPLDLPPVDDLARRLGGDVLQSGEILCLCPIHEADGQPHTPSCLVKVSRGRLISFCRSQRCDKTDWPAYRAALAARAGVDLALVGGKRGTTGNGILYHYRDASGAYSWTKQRRETPTGRKTFRSGVWDDQVGWTSHTRPVGAVALYGLPEIAVAIAGDPESLVLIVEGEKDADTGRKLGLPTTTAADGGRWPTTCTDTLVRIGVKRACILPDNDIAGRQHGMRVARSLLEAGIDVRWLEIPGLPRKGDITDWVDAGGTRAKLDNYLAGAPEYDPDVFEWRGRLVPAGLMSPADYRGGNDMGNLELVLANHPELRGKLRFNLFRQRVEVVDDLPWKTLASSKLTPLGYRARADEDLSHLAAYLIQDMNFAPFNIDAIDRAMRSEALKSSFDEAVEWLDGLPDWDGVRRVDTFLQDYFNVGGSTEEPKKTALYLAMTGYMFLGQVIRRIHDPGCQADYSLLLYGAQGDGKDKAYRTLFGVYLSESPPSLKVERASDRARTMAGYLLIHDAEMASFNKASPDDRKAALTRSHDKGRAAYAREVEDIPRRAPWAFSVNLRGSLTDPTGDRRCWPVEMMGKLEDDKVEAIKRDRLQLFAEAKARVAAGEPDWIDTPEKEGLLRWGQATFRPDAFGDLEDYVDRYITAEPIRAKPTPGDALTTWGWKPRKLPLTALTVSRFFEKVLGEVSGVGLGKHAAVNSVTVVTVYLRNMGWTLGRVRSEDVVADDSERGNTRAWRAPIGADDAPEPGADYNSGMLHGRPAAPESAGRKDALVRKTKRSKGNSEGVTVAKDGQKDDRATSTSGNRVKAQRLKTMADVAGYSLESLVKVKTFYDEGKKEKFTLPDSSGSTTLQHVSVVSATLLRASVGVSVLDDLPLEAMPIPDGVGVALATLYHGEPILAMDIETTGLDAERDRIRTVQFCDGVTVALVVFSAPLPAFAAFDQMRAFVESKRLVAHPARFDSAWLHAAGIDKALDDTALLWAAVHGGGNPWKGAHSSFVPISLASLAKTVLGVEVDKAEQMSDWAVEQLSDGQLQYAARDAVVTAATWEILVAHMQTRSSQAAIDIGAGYDDLCKSNALALQMERAGVLFDSAAHKAWTEKTALEAAPIRARIGALEPGLIADRKALGSTRQLNAIVRKRLEAMSPREARLSRLRWDRTAKGVDLSFGKDALAGVLQAGRLTGELRELVQALHDLKALTGKLTLFGDGFRQHVGQDGRLRGHFYAAGAITGRYVSQDPNLQNIFEEFRTYLVAKEGRVLVCADYSQLELRVLASLGKCPGMTAAFARGDDYHDTVARNAGIDRRQAKAINFGVIYGKGVESLSRDLNVDQGEAAEYLERWKEGAPGATAFLDAAPERYARDGGIATVRRWIDYLDDADASSKAGTRPRNYPIQGTAGDVLHRAMALLFDEIGDWPGNVVPLLTVHDEIVLECDQDRAEEVARLLPETMTKAFSDILPDGPTLHLVFGGIGNTWLEAKKHGGSLEKAARAAGQRPKMNGSHRLGQAIDDRPGAD